MHIQSYNRKQIAADTLPYSMNAAWIAHSSLCWAVGCGLLALVSAGLELVGGDVSGDGGA